MRKNLQFIAGRMELPISPREESRKAVLDGTGVIDTLRNLYPKYDLVEPFGRTMPICVFPAPAEEQGNLEAAIPNGGRQRLIPRPDEYPTDFWPDGEAEVRNDMANTSRYHYNDPTYAFVELRQGDSGPRIRLEMGWYFWSLATSERMDTELMDALRSNPNKTVNLQKLRRRDWLHGKLTDDDPKLDPVVSGKYRSAALSVSMTMLLENEAGYRVLLPPRSGRVATHPFFNHVAPSGIFQPLNAENPSPAAECSIERVLLREYVEELYDDPRYLRGDTLSTDPLREKEIHRLKKTIKSGDAELFYTGVSVNLLTLRPEICTTLLVRDHDWLCREIQKADKGQRPFRLSWEYLDVSGRDLLDSDSHRQPFLALDKSFQPVNGSGSLKASSLVPNGAAALWLAINAVQQR